MINKVTLIGNLGGDPEIRTLENGTTVGRFSLATSESYKDKEGNWQSQTEWHNVVVWRDLAEKAKHLVKGNTVYVEGKISSRKYTDKDGVEKNQTDIVANYFRLLDKREAAPQTPPAPNRTENARPYGGPIGGSGGFRSDSPMDLTAPVPEYMDGFDTLPF